MAFGGYLYNRERERERDVKIYIHIYICTHKHIPMYVGRGIEGICMKVVGFWARGLVGCLESHVLL